MKVIKYYLIGNKQTMSFDERYVLKKDKRILNKAIEKAGFNIKVFCKTFLEKEGEWTLLHSREISLEHLENLFKIP